MHARRLLSRRYAKRGKAGGATMTWHAFSVPIILL
jgi:hypothetical protein